MHHGVAAPPVRPRPLAPVVLHAQAARNAPVVHNTPELEAAADTLWTRKTLCWLESTLASAIVHMVLMIIFGLTFHIGRTDVNLEIVVGPQEESVPILETTPTVVTQVDVDPSAFSVAPAQTTVSVDAFSLAGAPSTSIAIPSEIGVFNADARDFAGKLLEGTGNGIGDLLGGAFGDRLGRAGAQTGAMQFSLIWDNYNDLDLHVVCPSGERISYLNTRSKCGGHLDVDMNAGFRTSNEPVENIYWNVKTAPRGVYRVYVVYYARRDPQSADGHFQLAVKIDKDVQLLTGEVSPQKREVLVGSFQRKYGAAAGKQ